MDSSMMEIVMRIVSEYVDAAECNYSLYPNNILPVASQLRAALGSKNILELPTLLTAEPEPCESRKITQAEATLIETRDKVIHLASIGLYQDADDILSAYASQVADKRAEELRAQVDTLSEEVRILRLYGNKDCTSQADEAIATTDPKP